ncbi:MAG: polysaccharide deacetylase family protein [Bacteroidota bacterium]
MLLIFVDKITERLIYTLDFIFRAREVSYELTNDWVYFKASDKLRLVYSDRFSEGFVQVLPSSLLFDEAIFPYALTKKLFYKEECLAFDQVCDPLASVFFVLSRYEEYIIRQRDEHERFEARNSIQQQFGWLEKTICEHWAEDLIAFLENQFQANLNAQKIPVKLVPTFDIDNTFAFQWKEGLRGFLGKYKDRLKKDKARIKARQLFQQEGKDPYDTYDTIKELAAKGFDVHVFWLLGEYAAYDKNISGNDPRHQKLIRELADFVSIGLHPSYRSNKSLYYLKNEHALLQQILKRNVTESRQHFLKLDFPATYRTLVSLGFKDDYTMGYADAVGFRNGTARSFPFFDLHKNSATALNVHPFAYMDVSLRTYLQLSPPAAKEKIKALYEEVSACGGDFVFLWHNETIGEFGPWKGWKSVFDYTINLPHEI